MAEISATAFNFAIDIFEQLFYNNYTNICSILECLMFSFLMKDLMNMRFILHSDCNGFFASVECLHNPEIRNKPVAVCGDADKRHGIILAKNELAKKYKIQTGEAVWQAKEKCPELVTVPPHYDRYLRFSKMATRIYSDYSDHIEPFGLDEAWIELTGSVTDFKQAENIAHEIRQRVKLELGITVSVGVSFNKIFAKLGSDYKKPDAVTVITPDNYKNVVHPLPSDCLLGVGKATRKKLLNIGVKTIGDITHTPREILRSHLGKFGDTLYAFANGYDTSPVKPLGYSRLPKSIGNSTTPSRNMENLDDVKIVLGVLTDSVCRRAREQGLAAKTVTVNIRDEDLFIINRQLTLARHINLTSEINAAALAVFDENYQWRKPIRSIGVTLSDFVRDFAPVQTSLFVNEVKREQKTQLDKSLDSLKKRFGAFCVRPAFMLKDKELSGFSPKEENIVHPVGYFG